MKNNRKKNRWVSAIYSRVLKTGTEQLAAANGSTENEYKVKSLSKNNILQVNNADHSRVVGKQIYF